LQLNIKKKNYYKQSKKDIDETLKLNEDLEIKIDLTRENYRLVAQRAATLFFVLQDLTSIDSMYQFSLDAYIQLFLLSIEKSPRSLKLNERIDKLNDYHTYSVYKYGCRVSKRESSDYFDLFKFS